MAFSPKSNEEISRLCRTRKVKSADDESNKWQHAVSMTSYFCLNLRHTQGIINYLILET